MQGSSRGAALAGEDALGTALDSGVNWTTLAEDLFAIAAAIDDNATLRRALADPSRQGDAKADLVGRLFDGKVTPGAVELLKALASQRWSTERDLSDTVESLAVETVVSCAEQGGRADQLEDELFRFERIVAGNVGLREALTDRRGDVHGKEQVISRLLEGKVAEETIRLVRQAVLVPRGRRFDRVLETYLAIPAPGASSCRPPSSARSTSTRPSAGASSTPSAPSMARRSTSTSSSTPRSSAASASRSATMSSTARSCAASRVPAATSASDLDLQHPPAPPARDTSSGPAKGRQPRRRDTMTELSIRPEEIRDALDSFVQSYEPGAASREEVGRVTDAGDGIAHVEGLPSAMTNELLQFSDGTLGIALNLDVHEIGVVVLGDFSGIEEGQEVKRTGEVLSVPVGDNFLGRVINPLGQPIDGLGEIEAEDRRALEIQAPSVVQRKSVHQPLQTGLKAVDAMTPIGRGQRQLIIGDRQTGKTTVAIDTIINQKRNWESGDPEQQVRCIYVAIGQKGSTIAGVKGTLEQAGALEYTTIVAAPASDSAGFKWLAPYAGSAIGQHWMYAGKHVLLVFDDLSKQAEAYRAVSLLLRRPPGREAYPGDVFYLHSRLLERCAKLSDALGAGSMTGLPIIETKGNDVSAFIPTNVISITDGQIFLETDLFNSGVRPAINVGISVSRVGGNAQIKAMKSVSGRLRLDLAQYRELEAFAAFGSDLDKASKAQLERGARLVELLKQPQYTPYAVERQVASIWAGTNGYLDEVPVGDVLRFEAEFLDFIGRSHKGIYDSIVQTGKLGDDVVSGLETAIKEFTSQFQTSEGHGIGTEAQAEELGDDERGQEKITRHVPPAKDGQGGSTRVATSSASG